LWETIKPYIVAKGVGLGRCTSLPNMGPRFRSLPFQNPNPYLVSLEIEATSFEVAPLCDGFFIKVPVDNVSYFSSQHNDIRRLCA
jgi:hypothetical protein